MKRSNRDLSILIMTTAACLLLVLAQVRAAGPAWFPGGERGRPAGEGAAAPAFELALRKHLESLLGEMRIECEGSDETRPAHDLEAGAVDETQIAPAGGQQGANGRPMDVRIDPQRFDDCPHVAIEDANGVHAEPPLDQRIDLHEHVIRAEEGLVCLHQLAPSRGGRRMMLVIPIEHGEQS